MRPGGNNFNYFPENKLTKLANSVQLKRMLVPCLGDWEPSWASCALPLLQRHASWHHAHRISQWSYDVARLPRYIINHSLSFHQSWSQWQSQKC